MKLPKILEDKREERALKDSFKRLCFRSGYHACFKDLLETDELKGLVDYSKRTSTFLKFAIETLDKANSNPGYAIALRDFNLLIQPIICAEKNALTSWQKFIGETND